VLPADPANPTNRAQPIQGILLANTGTPDSPTPADVRRYLGEFLADPRVIEFPRWLWLPILRLIILNTRPRRSARLYRRIWTAEGSPLLVHTQRLVEKLQTTLSAAAPGGVVVAAGMRYGNPSIAAALRSLRDQQVRKITVLPLFPQYSGTTSGTIFDAVVAELRAWRSMPAVQFIPSYHDHPAYIHAVAQSLKPGLAGRSAGTHLLLSFHGIPRRYVERGDPYRQECLRSAGLIARALGLPDDAWSVSFQSRFGPVEWLRPYTDEALAELAQRSLDQLDVACPGFAVDCLETVDEIGHEGKAAYQRAGGGAFCYLTCLNDSPEQIAALAQILQPYLNDINTPIQPIFGVNTPHG
jgi:protoporphyrin/coproporphyrin ferrochelatase